MTKVKTRSSIGKNNRKKGNLLEQQVARDMRDIGYTFAKTSRQASKLLDDCQVDLAFIPYNVQTKNGYNSNRPKPDIIFSEMGLLLKQNFPLNNPQHNYPKILIHKLPEKGTFATITYDFLLTLLKIKFDYEQK